MMLLGQTIQDITTKITNVEDMDSFKNINNFNNNYSNNRLISLKLIKEGDEE